MRIAIYINNFLEDDGWNKMVEMLFRQIANNQPQHEFIFITNIALKDGFAGTLNFTNIILPYTGNRVPWSKFLYKHKLFTLLKKHDADVFINSDSSILLYAKTKQVILVKDTAFLQLLASAKTNLIFLKKRLQKKLKNVNAFVFFNATLPNGFLDKYQIATEKVKQAGFFASPELRPMDWHEKEVVKDKYCDTKEFFLYKMNAENPKDPLVLLKAFSIFKKRQQSNMQLLLVNKSRKAANNINQKLSTYKYRNEVKILDGLPQSEIMDLQAAAYCVLVFSDAELDLPLLNTMQTGVPVIILQDEEVAENDAVAFLQADANSAASIAEQMKIIYKDENLRNRLIAKGLKTADENTVEATSLQVWQTIETAVKG